jgi:hypothetical protein
MEPLQVRNHSNRLFSFCPAGTLLKQYFVPAEFLVKP